MGSTVAVHELAALQTQPRAIRNICVMAHVDHGKTTLSDSLIASNGLIHPKLVGKLRYLDYRDEEQLRCITMKSSSISLLFKPKKSAAAAAGGLSRSGGASRPDLPAYLVNLIDSPGHVDFCSEVSTAARLSDGALVLVDVCEGVLVQTHAVLRQAWEERVKPCLVINKVDRLITELKMTPMEAYERMKSIIVEVNGIISAFRSERYMSDVDMMVAGKEAAAAGSEAAMVAEEEDEDEEDAFSPEKGNVAFTSAVDGWGFRIDEFAGMYASKLGASAASLQKGLWGDRYFVPKTKSIVGKKAAGGKYKPMFAQFILEPLWKLYGLVFDGGGVAGGAGGGGGGAKEELLKIIKAMNILVPPRELQQKDPKAVIQSVMSRWLPLSDAVLAMAVECLPDPADAQKERSRRLLPLRADPDIVSGVLVKNEDGEAGEEEEEKQNKAKRERAVAEAYRAVECCDASEDAPCIVFVSKMFAVPLHMLPTRRGTHGEILREELHEEDGEVITHANDNTQECFLAFARVFSGVLQVGRKMHVLSAAYNPLAADLESNRRHRQEAVLSGLYMMMGRGLEPQTSVPAGNVVAIRGLGQCILKYATLSSSPHCYPFTSMLFQAAPLVRVAVEPADPAEMAALARGLRLLNRADPFIEVLVSSTGEHVIGAAGEVHLATCIKDLRERFARIELAVSPPLVAFRETIASAATTTTGAGGGGGPAAAASMVAFSTASGGGEKEKGDKKQWVEAATPNGRCKVRVCVSRLPDALTAVLDGSEEVLKGILVDGVIGCNSNSSSSSSRGEVIGRSGERCGDVRNTDDDEKGSSSERSLMSSVAAGGGGGGGISARLDDPVGLLCSRLLAAVGAEEKDSDGPSLTCPSARSKGSNATMGSGGQQKKAGSTGQGGGDGGGSSTSWKRGWSFDLTRIWALGPRRVGPCALLVPGDGRSGRHCSRWIEEAMDLGAVMIRGVPEVSLKLGLVEKGEEEEEEEIEGVGRAVLIAEAESLENSVLAGFQLATSAGPLCEEPMWGLAFTIEAIIMAAPLREKSAAMADENGAGMMASAPASGVEQYGPFSGQVMTTVKEACRMAMMGASPRLVEAMYFCEVNTSSDMLGQAYGVLAKRRARIIREDMREGTAMFTIHAYMPVAESFGFAEELRRKTSGAASPQLVLSHWEAMAEDPFFVPRTEEEVEEFGDGASVLPSVGRRFMDAVRRRKGLHVEEKLVEKATKQRTLAKKV
ncbi:hypothetical protein CBR_g53556 [Chara braunii]|uniref:Ribosome assembly protein 1 n=1 Tax=Chara braunii TaxID=69332 RepID=A0A388MB93_CHABU|nr:hypothetical protein CBR_g53556 [Chara braunii]|eukprot:GBG91742.1 hypothetical protein CBR_g53556 [Chara braunii]